MNEKLLAGSIAVELGYLNAEQLRTCIREQNGSLDPRPIGTLFVEKGFLSPHQLEGLLNEQKNRMRMGNDGGALFGQLALERNFIDTARLGECVREQLRIPEGQPRPRLGTVMRRKGYLSDDQFHELLKIQGKAIYRCVTCGHSSSHPVDAPPTEALCERCRDRMTHVPGDREGLPGSATDLAASFRAPLARMGKFEILGEIARGSMAIIFKAYDRSLERTVVLKVLKEGDTDSDFVKRLHREAAIAAKLQHPNIVTIYEVGETEGVHYLCMDYIPGWDLLDYLRVRRIPRERALKLFEKICRAVHFAHQHGVIHRDLKPSNILIKKDGTPYITDFGLAKSLESAAGLTKEGTTIGTPYYMSPEQVLGRLQEIDDKSDIYSLGVILYELLTGTPPHVGVCTMDIYQRILSEEPRRLAEVLPDIDPDLEAVCLKAMDKERALRYATAEELADDVARYLAAEPVQAARPTPWRIFRKRLRKHRRRILTAAAILVFAGCLTWAISDLLERSRVNDHLESAAAAVTRGAWEEANRLYHEAVALDPQNSEARSGIQRTQERIESEHRRKLDDERSRRRASAQPFYDLASRKAAEVQILTRQPRWTDTDLQRLCEEAIREIDRALAADAEFAEAHYLRGWCLHEMNRSMEALEDLDRAIDLMHQGHSSALLLRGKIAFSRVIAMRLQDRFRTRSSGDGFRLAWAESDTEVQNLRRKASEDFRQASELTAQKEFRALAEGYLALMEGDPAKAERAFSDCLEANRLNADGHYGRGFCLFLMERFEEAIPPLTEALHQKPNLFGAYSPLAFSHLYTGQPSEALKLLRTASEIYEDGQTYNDFGCALMMSGEQDQALTWFNKAIPLLPGPAGYTCRENKIKILYVLGRYDSAISEAEDLLQEHHSFEALKFAGVALLARGDNVEAADYLDRALQLRNDDYDVVWKYADARYNLGEYDEALELIEQALQLEALKPQGINSRGMIHDALGRVDEARRDFSTAIELDPGYVTAYLNLSTLLTREARYSEAIEVLNALTEAVPDRAAEARTRINEIQKRMREIPSPQPKE